jgi:succinylglutamic semialdehyde dehydrogenase
MNNGVYINGDWRPGHGPAFQSYDPATGAIVFEATSADNADVIRTVIAARKAFPKWGAKTRSERIAVIKRYAEALKAREADIAEAICRDTGKPLWEGKAEAATMIGKAALSIRAYNERTGERSEEAVFGRLSLAHKPWGVMAVLGPFNFPGHLPNGHIVPALLAGNTVVFKPSELAPLVSTLMVKAFEEAELPEGVVNVVMGGRDTGAYLLAANGIDGVLFTGSATTGTAIHRQFGGRPEVILALEMGGNNALIVWHPCGVEEAADQIVHSAFITAGQRCSCARRLILPKGDWGDAVLAGVVARIKTMVVGPWNGAKEPFIGPLISPTQAARMQSTMVELKARGAVSIIDPVIGSPGPAFVRPGMMDVTNAKDVPDEELFAPFLQVTRVATFEKALQVANDTRFGLSGGLVCDDPARWEEAQNTLRAGVLNWNRPTTGASGAMPFGGPGLSGDGRPSAYYAADYCAWPVARQEADKATRLPAPGLN